MSEVNALVNQSVEKTPLSNADNETVSSEPDIYYILLDGYSRSDLLSEGGFDNQEFLNHLTELGFIIPQCGQSNYDKTALSVATTLNMNYLDAMGIKESDLKYPRHQRILKPYIKDNLVRSKIHESGYKFITNQSSYFFLDIPDSDIYINDDYSSTIYSSEKIETAKFQQLFINTTLVRIFIDWLHSNPNNSEKIPLPVIELLSPMSLDSYQNFFYGPNFSDYQLGRYHLESLEKISRIPDKKFVYSHLLITHAPFTFTAQGDFETEEQASYKGYLQTIKYINSQMLELIPKLISQSVKPPIIILQSDHSFTMDGTTTTRNFQAYYFPGMKQDELDKDFTNVNTFRLVFSKYLGEDMPLHPNISYKIDYKNPSDKQVLEKSCP